ncbi:MAG TPA: carboxyl transferase domain-containing protein [Mycobacteriales bacterium]|nr:carboxyl transferase domain-containing protein [Mycobacteriales bacterium]
MDEQPLRPELHELQVRQHVLSDAGRPDAVAKRHGSGRRTARENLEELLDPGSWVEYGGFAIAAQRARRSMEELINATQADGIIAGIGRANTAVVGEEQAGCAALSYDYMVLAGSQGMTGHRKTDRMFELIERMRLPVVLFAEGGGGRPGDTDHAMVGGLDIMTFSLFARLSGVVPRIGIAGGYCFAGNAALFGLCDITIATEGSSIGMGGPPMIEGGGLGVVSPDDVGPVSMHERTGAIDLLARDDTHATELARRALAYFQGRAHDWSCADQTALRDVVPENRRRAYEVRRAVELVADTGSVLELRPRFGRGVVTALARLEGRPVGIIANNPMHLAGAITSDVADKSARFLQLCDAFGLPVLALVDTPGIMVGPDAEKTALVRHSARLFNVGANLRVPLFAVILRKGYGLGAMAMTGGSFHAALGTVAWPTGEVGGMNLEGAVRLGLRRELAAIEDEDERQRVYEAAVAGAYATGKALSAATYFEIDDVIDPAETRARAVATLFASRGPGPTERRLVDPW